MAGCEGEIAHRLAVPDEVSTVTRRDGRVRAVCQGTAALPPGRTADLHLRGHVISTRTDSCVSVCKSQPSGTTPFPAVASASTLNEGSAGKALLPGHRGACQGGGPLDACVVTI